MSTKKQAFAVTFFGDMYHINKAIQISLPTYTDYDVTIVTIPSLIATNFSRLQRASNLSAAFE